MMSAESCGVCGGDGRVSNSFGLTTRCPACAGTGRRSEFTGMHDVTKTKPSHHRPTNKEAAAAKPQAPVTLEGSKLASEVQNGPHTPEVKARLIREIIEYELSHGTCTQTFQRKIRKQLRPST